MNGNQSFPIDWNVYLLLFFTHFRPRIMVGLFTVASNSLCATDKDYQGFLCPLSKLINITSIVPIYKTSVKIFMKIKGKRFTSLYVMSQQCLHLEFSP